VKISLCFGEAVLENEAIYAMESRFNRCDIIDVPADLFQRRVHAIYLVKRRRWMRREKWVISGEK